MSTRRTQTQIIKNLRVRKSEIVDATKGLKTSEKYRKNFLEKRSNQVSSLQKDKM